MNDIVEEPSIALLVQTLREGTVKVEFTKADGMHRVMQCTTNMSNIPASQHPTGVKTKSNNTVISVFDLEKQSWRSIKKDRISTWNVDE